MSANQYLSPPQFHGTGAAKPTKASATPPVTPPTTAPTSSNPGGGPNAASMWSFSAASKTAASQSSES